MTFNNIRVCHLTSVHPYHDTRIFYKECGTLAAAGYDIHLVVPNISDKTIQGIHLHGVSAPTGNRLTRMVRATWAVYRKALSLDADIYHFHDPELIPVGLWLRQQGKRVIYDIHEDVPRQVRSRTYLPKITRTPISWMMGLLENLGSHRFSALVAATPTIGKRFTSRPSPVIVVNNYPFLNELIIDHPIPWDERANSIGFVGRISTATGIVQMVEAMAYTTEKISVTLKLAGRFRSERQRQELLCHRGWKNIEELGQLDRIGVANLLGQVRAGLVIFTPIPNNIEGQPTKLFEYMSAGIPAIASDFPVWRKLIGDFNCCVFVDPLDPKAIAAAIEELITQPQKAKEMGQRGRKAIETHYNWEKESQKLLNLYAQLLASNGAKS